MITGPNFLDCITKSCFSKNVSQICILICTQSYKQALLCICMCMYISKIYKLECILYNITSYKEYFILNLLLIVDLRKMLIMLLSSSYDKVYFFLIFENYVSSLVYNIF